MLWLQLIKCEDLLLFCTDGQTHGSWSDKTSNLKMFSDFS